MAITTLDMAIAGMKPPLDFMKVATPTLVAGRHHSLAYLAGIPGPMAAPSPGMGGAALTSYLGQLPYTNPVSGNKHIARMVGQATIAGTLFLCDRLWHNSGIVITSTSPQAIDSVEFPARDNNGAVNGEGVMAAVEVSGATGAGTPTLTLGYTNSDNQNGKSATNIVPAAASSAIGCFHPIGLAAGDGGVKSIQTLTLSATWTSGVIHLVAFRVMARLELPLAQTPNAFDLVTGGMPRCFDNTVPFLVFLPATTTASFIGGNVIFTEG